MTNRTRLMIIGGLTLVLGAFVAFTVYRIGTTTARPILPTKLAAESAGSGLPGLIPPGMRAVSVRVNEVVAVAGFVVPGTRVNVLLTGAPRGDSEQQTTTVLENVAVIAAGQRLERNAAGEPQNTAVITLLVTPDDAQKLTLARNEGRIQLMLRNPLDREPMQRDTPLKPPGVPPSPRSQSQVQRLL